MATEVKTAFTATLHVLVIAAIGAIAPVLRRLQRFESQLLLPAAPQHPDALVRIAILAAQPLEVPAARFVLMQGENHDGYRRSRRAIRQ